MNFFCKGGFAMRGRSSQNIWILVLLMLAGVVLGGFIAKLVFVLQAGLCGTFGICFSTKN